MANSLMQIVSDGSLSTIPLTIKFFEQSHIKVFVNNVELPDGTYTFAWSGATTITITPAVALGAEVSVRRKTPANEVLHDFQAGAVFSEVSVDENFRQELFLLQEASEQSLVTDLFDDLDMHGNGVRNVRAATLPGDAVNLAQAVQIAEAGGTSTLRTELASPGGVGLLGGTHLSVTSTKYAGGASVSNADNTAAITAAVADAVATGLPLFWPGMYRVIGNIPNMHLVYHIGPGGITREGASYRVHPLEWHSNTIYCAPSGSDTNDGCSPAYPVKTTQRCMDLLGVLGSIGALQHGSWRFKLAPGTYTGGIFSGFVPVQTHVLFEGSLGIDGLPDVVVDATGSTTASGLYFFNGPSLLKIDSIAGNNFRSTSVSSGLVFYGKGISEAWVLNCSAYNNIWSGLNADSIGRLLVTGGTYDSNTQYNIRARGGIAIAIGIYGAANRVTLKNNVTAAQVRDGCTGHFDNFDIINHPSTPTGTGVWVANAARVTYNAGSFTNVNLGTLASDNATISIGADVTFTNTNTKYRTENNGTLDNSVDYPAGQGLGFDVFRKEYTVGSYGYTGLQPSSSSSAYAIFSTRTGVVDYSFLVNAASRQRLIFGYGTTAATRDKFVVDFNAVSNREDHYIDGVVAFRVKPGAVSAGADNTTTLGEGGVRWSTVYAATGTINTSDVRYKTAPEPIAEAVLDAVDSVPIVMYQWLDAIALKGDSARWHYGIMAQVLRDAFLAHGVDGTTLGVLCYDKWDAVYEPVYDEWVEERATVNHLGESVTELINHSVPTGEYKLTTPAGDRWGIRPDQCMWLMLSAARRTLAKQAATLAGIDARLSMLESSV